MENRTLLCRLRHPHARHATCLLNDAPLFAECQLRFTEGQGRAHQVALYSPGGEVHKTQPPLFRLHLGRSSSMNIVYDGNVNHVPVFPSRSWAPSRV